MSQSDSDFGRSSKILGQFFGQAISHSKFHAFFDYMGNGHNSMNDIALCISLWTSVTVGEHLAFRKQLINVTSNDKYLDNFGTPKCFGHFWTTFLVSIRPWIRHDVRNVRILHL